MFFKARPVLTAMAMALVQASGMSQSVHPLLPPDQVAAARAQQPQRAAQALAFLKGQVQALGLGVQDSFLEQTVFTNAQGQTIARYQQLHQGLPVFGSALSVRIDPDGSAHLIAQDRAPGLTVDAALNLTAADAILAAHRNLAPKGSYASTPTADRIIFPTLLSQGFSLTMDATGAPLLDRDASLVGPLPTHAYVQAYLVKAPFNNDQDGFREYNLVVSAENGQVLRKWDDAAGLLKQAPRSIEPVTYANQARLAASAPVVEAHPRLQAMKAAAVRSVAAQSSFGGMVPAQGWGKDMYLGLVDLDTAQSALGSGYDLVDLTRGTANPHPVFQTIGSQTWYCDVTPSVVANFQAPQTDYEFPYLGYFFGTYSMDNMAWSGDGTTPAGSTTNIWGDGLVYSSPYNFNNYNITNHPTTIPPFHYADANGQTDAVGAHFASQVTYDMYKNVMGWLGVDGKDSGMLSVVHDNLGGFENAHFSYVDGMMHYGDGTQGPNNPKGYSSFATISIGGHEMSHGVMHHLAAVNYWGEGMGLNEANSDIMGVSVEAYSMRGADDPLDKLPEGKIGWTMSPEISPTLTPLRWLYKPSKDGASADFWYSGVNNLDGHYSMGVPNRFFYFLAEGASADPASDFHSAYLPQGMTGIGLDQAAHIWFKAVSEHMTNTTSIRGMRQPLLDAVADLYGATSVQGQAVANALAAVNIGAAYGTQGRPLVTLPTLIDPNSPLGVLGLPTEAYAGVGIQYLYYTVPMVPIGDKVKLNVNVTNTDNTAVDWATGWANWMVPFPNDGGSNGTGAAGPMAANGSFDAQGYYTAPLGIPKFCMTKATSHADPLEFAYLPVVTVQLDTDGDAENDAVDMATFALDFNLPRMVAEDVAKGGYPTGYLYWYYSDPTTIGYSFDDYTLQAWNQAFMTAFGQ